MDNSLAREHVDMTKLNNGLIMDKFTEQTTIENIKSRCDKLKKKERRLFTIGEMFELSRMYSEDNDGNEFELKMKEHMSQLHHR